MDCPAQRIIISGPPGSGKTTLIEALRSAGYVCFDEVSRNLIREQLSSGGDLTPWADLANFAEVCFQRMRTQLDTSHFHERCFFDRGVPDLIGYLRCSAKPVPSRFWEVSSTYTRLVLMAPPWEAIYVREPERPQSFAESSKLALELVRAYSDCRFAIVELPRLPVKERVLFVSDVLRIRRLTSFSLWEN